MSDYVKEYNHNDLDEIVFEHRNKEYGAYDLRKSYRGILTKAVLIGVLLFSLAIAIPFVMMKIEQMQGKKETKVDLNLTNLEDDIPEEPIIEEIPEEEPPPPPPKEEEQIEVIQNVVPEPVKDPPVETPPPPISVQKETVTGLKAQEGVKKPNATPPPPPPPKNTGKGKAVDVKVDAKKIYTEVEQLAEFPGGEDAFREYIAEDFDTSVIEDEDDVVTTTVSFVVEKDGTMTQVKASGGPSEYKAEAVRTVKSIRKKWKPAKVDGKPVRYRYRIPISMQPPEF